MKIRAIYLYLIFTLWIGFLVALLKYSNFNLTGLGITLSFLTLIFAPGIFLKRLINWHLKDFTIKMFYVVGLGLGFHFFISLLGLLVRLTLDQVMFIDLFGIIVLFVLSVFHDRQTIWENNLKSWFKEQTVMDWLLSIFLIGGSLMAFLGVNAQSGASVGDSGFHLAILNKIVSSPTLDNHNLWPVRTTSLNIVYSFPIWHILIAWFGKFLNINIFTSYFQMDLPLTILVLLVWWGFAKTIFPNRYFASVIFLAFLVYFLSAGFFYALVPVRSPDSLNRLLIFPLLLGLTANYLFDKNQKIWSSVIFLTFLSIFVGLIHFTQLIEYVLILLVFIILFLIFNRQKEVMKKIGWLMLVLGGVISLYLGIFQHEAVKQFLSENTQSFTSDTFRNKDYRSGNIFYLYWVFAWLFLALFFKKNNRFIFLASIPLTLSLITWEVFHLRPLFLKYLGEIFTIRAITDIPGFVFFGFLLLLLIFALNYLLSKVSRWYAYIFYGFLAVIFLMEIFIFSFRNLFFKFIDETFFSGKNLFVITYFWWIIIILVFLATIIYFFVHYYKKSDLSINAPKDKFNFIIITFVIFIMLALPYGVDYWQKITNNPKSIFASHEIKYYGDIHVIGREKTVEFIKTLPSSAVLATSNTDMAQIALLYCQCYAAEYPYGITKFNYSLTLFDSSNTLEQRQVVLKEHSIDYIITINPTEEKLFSDYPDVFRNVFENNFQYQVDSKKKGIYQKQVNLKIYKYNL